MDAVEGCLYDLVASDLFNLNSNNQAKVKVF